MTVLLPEKRERFFYIGGTEARDGVENDNQ